MEKVNLNVCPLFEGKLDDVLQKADLKQTTGSESLAPMSQKAVSDQLALIREALASYREQLYTMLPGLVPLLSQVSGTVYYGEWRLSTPDTFRYGVQHESIVEQTFDSGEISVKISDFAIDESVDADPAILIRFSDAKTKRCNLFFVFALRRGACTVRYETESTVWQYLTTFAAPEYSYMYAGATLRVQRLNRGDRHVYRVYFGEHLLFSYVDDNDVFPSLSVRAGFGTIGCAGTFRYWKTEDLKPTMELFALLHAKSHESDAVQDEPLSESEPSLAEG